MNDDVFRYLSVKNREKVFSLIKAYNECNDRYDRWRHYRSQ